MEEKSQLLLKEKSLTPSLICCLNSEVLPDINEQ